MFDFTNQVAVITGAVGNLGFATAQAFQTCGASTVLVDRSTERLMQAYPGLIGSSGHMFAGEIDLTNAASIARMVDAALDRFGRIDVLVNTVGGFRGGRPLHESDPSDWDFLFGINVRTAAECSRAVIPAMIRAGRGRIINIGSKRSLAGDAGFSAYSASKCAVLRLTESLAAELLNLGINVNCVLPGPIDTPQNRKGWPGADYSRWVEPAAVADAILFLAANESRGISGAAIPVYGKS